VHISGESGDEFFSLLGNSRSSSEFSLDVLEFVVLGEFASHQQPKQSFTKRFIASGNGLEDSGQISNGVASEGDTVLGGEEGGVPDDREHVSHASDGLVNSDGTEGFVAVLGLDFLEFGLLLGNDLTKFSLKEGFRVRSEAGV